MISYKVLIILTVIFHIITYCNGGKKETKDEILKSINESQDYKNCEDILTKFGFKIDSGYYNLLYILQFTVIVEDNPDNDMIFWNHMKSKLGISKMDNGKSTEKNEQTSSSTEKEFMEKYDIMEMIEENDDWNDPERIEVEDNDPTTSVTLVDATSTISNEDQTKIDMAEFIYSFYKDASKVDYKEWKMLLNPSIFCCRDLDKKVELKENLLKVELKENKEKVELKENKENKERAMKELTEKYNKESNEKLLKKKVIDECANPVLKFKMEINGKEYKYDENNIFRFVITLMDLDMNSKLPEVEAIVNEMEENQLNYLNYIKSFSEDNDREYHMFTISSLCQNYVYGKEVKVQNLQKEKENKDGGDNHSSFRPS